MKITLIAALGFTALVGCVSAAGTSQSVPDVCPASYNPHLCIVEADGIYYAAHGTNKCEAIKKLRAVVPSLDPQQAECGEVYK